MATFGDVISASFADVLTALTLMPARRQVITSMIATLTAHLQLTGYNLTEIVILQNNQQEKISIHDCSCKELFTYHVIQFGEFSVPP